MPRDRRQPQPGAAGHPPDDAGAIDLPDDEPRTGPTSVLTFAVSISLLVHAIILLILSQQFIFAPVGDPESAGEDGLEMAIITDAELQEIAEASLAIEAPPVEQQLDSMSPAVDFSTPMSEQALMSADAGDVVALLGAGQGDSLDSLEVSGLSSTASSFFGLEARGVRFAYIVDVSGSMATDGRIEVLQQELSRTIQALEPQSQFIVIAYNSDAIPLGPRRWNAAMEREKTEARREIGALIATGGTEPIPAFEIAFSLRPRPDAIYFMTDGNFGTRSSAVAARIRRLNEAGATRTPIHCITLVDASGARAMRRVARESGGRYRHVAGPSR